MENKKIIKLRTEIDKMNLKLIKIIEKRQNKVEQIVKIKKEENILIEDLKREKEIIRKLSNKSILSQKFIKNLFQTIFKESKKNI